MKKALKRVKRHSLSVCVDRLLLNILWYGLLLNARAKFIAEVESYLKIMKHANLKGNV